MPLSYNLNDDEDHQVSFYRTNIIHVITSVSRRLNKSCMKFKIRIHPVLCEGCMLLTSRNHLHYICTQWGRHDCNQCLSESSNLDKGEVYNIM